ncbi:MAG TPA: glycosyltransferase [Chthoniobacteraceae bacterium]|nr:glycosyltransferase [Chthoniobacteraceae bacterium]
MSAAPGIPCVSVIMPVYNGEKFLRSSMESVLAQAGVRVELIIVDGASTDGSAAIAKSFDDRVRYFCNERDTLAIARNFGIAQGTHPLIAFMSSDDLWAEHKLEKQARWLAEHPGAGICSCHTRHFLHEGSDEWPPSFAVNPPDAELAALIPETLLYRREVFNRVGLFDETYRNAADDVDWILRAQHAGEEIGMLPEVLLFKGVHGNNVTYSRPGVQSDLLRALHGRVRRKAGQ